jgi:excisionase family DNA binding protein
MEAQNRLLRPSEAAEMLAISPRTLRRYIADGHVPVRRLPSGHMRIRQGVIDAMMGDEEGTRPQPRQREAAARQGLRRTLERIGGVTARPFGLGDSPCAMSRWP